MPAVSTCCADCFTDVRVIIVTDGSDRPVEESLLHAKVTARKPSNGKRGKAFEPARDVESEAVLDQPRSLLLWDCPVCGYADSTYADAETRRALT